MTILTGMLMDTHLDLLWQDTDEDITKPHAFFGGRVCWLRNGDNCCGKTYNDDIHKREEVPCDHSYRCVDCDDELNLKEYRKLVLKEAAEACREMAKRYDFDIEGCDADQLERYCEGIECSNRLADIIEKDEMYKWLGGKKVS